MSSAFEHDQRPGIRYGESRSSWKSGRESRSMPVSPESSKLSFRNVWPSPFYYRSTSGNIQMRCELALRVLAAMTTLVASTGCEVRTRNPLFTPQDKEIVAGSSLPGDWQEVDLKFKSSPSESPRLFRIESQKPASNEYTIIMFQDGLRLGKLEHAHVIRLGETEFIDFPVSAGPDDSIYLILRIRYGDKTFALDSIRPEFLTQHPNRLKHEIVEWFGGKYTMITASTQDLREFVRENGKNELAWKRSYRSYKRQAER